VPSPSVVDVDPAEVGSPPKYLRIPADGKEIPVPISMYVSPSSSKTPSLSTNKSMKCIRPLSNKITSFLCTSFEGDEDKSDVRTAEHIRTSSYASAK